MRTFTGRRMGSEHELRQPLLEDCRHVEASSRTRKIRNESTTATSLKRLPRFSLVDYKPLNGIPYRVLEPSNDDILFTCHAFSADGTCFATGDDSGGIRLWRTADFKLIDERSKAFEHPVDCLSFEHNENDRLIAIDTKGHYRRMKLSWSSDESQSSREDASATECMRLLLSTEMKDKFQSTIETELPMSTVRKHQFSKNGQILLLTHSTSTYSERDYEINAMEVFKQGDSTTIIIRLDKDDEHHQKGLPLLAENGESVLVCSVSKTEVWPRLDFDAKTQKKDSITLKGTCAVWGLQGQYLLLWRTDSEEPTLSVYKTEDLSRHHHRSRQAKPRWEKKFPAGESRYEARMLEPLSETGESIEVLIAEMDVKGNRRMLIWDVVNDSENNELLISAKRQSTPNEAASKTHNRPVDEIAEVSQLDLDIESCKHRHRIMEAAHPKFCISKNKQWLGTFSQKFQSCSIAAVRSGATVWSSNSPKCLQSASHEMPTEAMFDPNGDHFMIMGNRGIVVCTPEFLSDRPCAEECDQTFLKAYACLPSQSLASALEDREHDNEFPEWITKVTRIINNNSDISDATQSADGKRLAFIVPDRETPSQPIRSSRIVCLEEGAAGDYLDLAFKDAGTEAASESFIPNRLFLYDNGNGPDQGLVAFSLIDKPTAVFIDIRTRKMRENNLENIDRCLRISQTADRNKVTILDIRKVIILDLRSETTSEIEYKVDFTNLLGLVTATTKWEFARRLNRGLEGTQKRVSDDGLCVLLSWDQGMQESIVVHPSSRQKEVEDLLKQPYKMLSDYCTLSSDGRATCFIDMHEIPNSRITIGIFNESDKRVFHRIYIPFSLTDKMDMLLDDAYSVEYNFMCSTSRVRNKEGTLDVQPAQNSREGRNIDLLAETRSKRQDGRSPAEKMSTVFCGISDDGSEIFFDRGQLDLSFFPTLGKQRIRCFEFRDTADSTARYEKLDAKDREDIHKCFQRLAVRNGPSFVNTPYGSGQSFFREAFGNGDRDVVKCCIAHAEKSGVLLDVGDVPCFDDVKEEAIKPADRNIIRKLKDFLRRCLSITPTKSNRPRRKESSNILKEALDEKSKERVKEAVELICSPTTPFRSASRIMKVYYQQLWKEYPEVMMTILTQEPMFSETCQPRIHDDFLKLASNGSKDSLLGTTNTVLDWAFIDSPKVIEKTWKERNQQIAKERECEDDKATVQASLKILRIEDAARIGMNGIIRPLLLQNAPVNLFCSEAVKNVVQYKWSAFWKQRFRRYAGFYAIYLILFTTYSTLVARSSVVCEDDPFIDSAKHCSLAFIVLFGMHMLYEELCQLKTFVKDGHKYLGSKISGVAYFFKSIWNWVDLASCVLLLLFIPALHISACRVSDSKTVPSNGSQESLSSVLDQALSATLALEAVLMSTKAWYFAQPFQSFGALVLMVRNVIVDCFAFLVLSFAVVFGFGLALHILHRHAPADDVPGINDDSERHEDVLRDYDSLPNSLLTLFYALFGDFEAEFPDVNRFFTPLFTLFFGLYMIVAVILLLNLLIAIMGDTFDKTKSSEESQMLMARASFIDACEASLEGRKRKEIEKDTGEYLCVLEYADGGAVHDIPSWTGKVRMLDDRFKSCIKETEEILKEETRKQDENLKIELRKHDDNLRKEMKKENEHLKKEIKKENEKLKADLKKQNDNLYHLVQKMFQKIETESKTTKGQTPTAEGGDKPDDANISAMETDGGKQEDTAGRKEDGPGSGSASGEGSSNP